MVAGQPTEGAVQPWRIEAAHLGPGFGERLEQSRAADAEPAHPVIDHAHGNTRPRAFGKGLGKAAADDIVGYEVILEQNRMPCGGNRSEPGRIVLGGVAQQAHGIAAPQGGTGSP
jgi:hypothetical protein